MAETEEILIKDFEILRYNLKKELAVEIHKITNKDLNFIYSAFKYNLMTLDQLGEILGLSRGGIEHQMMSVNKKTGERRINYHIARPFITSNKKPGPIFAVVDYKLISFIKKRLKIDK